MYSAQTFLKTHPELIEDRRDRFRLPHSASAAFSESLRIVQTTPRARTWILPATNMETEVVYYRQRHGELGLKGPVPHLRDQLSKDTGTELALKVDAGLSFVELAVNAGVFVKPILLYYGCAHLCGVLSRCFLNWHQDRPGHGISCNRLNGGVGQTTVEVQDKGLFPRLATACFLLTGCPTIFSELVTYSGLQRQSQAESAGTPVEAFGRIETGQNRQKMTLAETLAFKYGDEVENMKTVYGYRKLPKGTREMNRFLFDVLILFVASHLARYDVLGWKEILEGKTNSYLVQFRQAFRRFTQQGVDCVLYALEYPAQI